MPTLAIFVFSAFAQIDNEFILDVNTALDLQSAPKTLGIIGAGAIGIQLAGIWNKLGTKVVLLEINILLTC
jgi:dihydrolipoamide dehydrogenase